MAEAAYNPDEIAWDSQVLGEPDNDAQSDMAILSTPIPDSPPSGEMVSNEELQSLRSAAQVVAQFNANPIQSVQQIAQQLGLQIVHPGQGQHSSQPAAQTSQEDDIASLIEEDSLKFLAPVISKIANKIADDRIAKEVGPIRQNQDEIATRNRQSEYVLAAQDLAARHPDWHARENDMQNRLSFIKQAISGGSLIHPQYGNLLEMLYSWASGKNQARGEVATQMREAPLNRAPSSATNGDSGPNILQLIAKAPKDKHLELAFDQAIRELGL